MVGHHVHFKASVPNTWASIKAQQQVKTKAKEAEPAIDDPNALPEQVCECGRTKEYKDRACERCKAMESVRASKQSDIVEKAIMQSLADDGPSTIHELAERDIGDVKVITSIVKRLTKAGTLAARRRGRWWQYMLPEDSL